MLAGTVRQYARLFGGTVETHCEILVNDLTIWKTMKNSSKIHTIREKVESFRSREQMKDDVRIQLLIESTGQ